MGKKKTFIDKKSAQRFRLLPASAVQPDEPTEEFHLTKEHKEAQHKFGIFYDDNYDYMQHLRERNEKSMMLAADEVRSVVRAPAMPVVESKRVVFDEDVDRALDGEPGEGDLEDDFIALAGGVVEDRLMLPRRPKMGTDSDEEEEEEDDEDLFNRGYEDYDMEDEETEEEGPVERHGEGRDVDAAFDAMLENYGEEQMGELEGEAVDIQGGLEPSDKRLRKLVGEKRGLPEYDTEFAKQYVKERVKHMQKNEKDELEEVEVEVAASKRMKWDCESFATQHSSIYNHPSLIKEPSARLSKRALRRLREEPVEEEEEDEDMEEDGQSECTTTTVRRRGETAEERKERKQAVKEARRVRRAEKKENKTAFAVEHRKVVSSRLGHIKAKTIV